MGRLPTDPVSQLASVNPLRWIFWRWPALLPRVQLAEGAAQLAELIECYEGAMHSEGEEGEGAAAEPVSCWSGPGGLCATSCLE